MKRMFGLEGAVESAAAAERVNEVAINTAAMRRDVFFMIEINWGKIETVKREDED